MMACSTKETIKTLGVEVMQIRLSILNKDQKVLANQTYDITITADFEKASADIWRTARQSSPLANPQLDQFLGGLDDLWGATMKLDKVA
jgi:hypothetical protein